MSTGLPCDQVAGSARSSAASVASLSGGQLAAGQRQRIGRQHAGAAAVGQDGQPLAAQGPRARQRLGGVEQVVQRLDAQHAGAPERGVEDLVRAGQRAGVRGGRLRALRARGPP